MRLFSLVRWQGRFLSAVAVLVLTALPANSQDAQNTSAQMAVAPPGDSIQDLQNQLREMKTMLTEMHAEMLRSHAESLELRQELEATRQLFAAAGLQAKNAPGASGETSPGSAPAQGAQGSEQSAATSAEEQQLLSAKVGELHQTKVESGSKYPVRLSGIVLMNLFSNHGVVDNVDFPVLALTDHPIDSRGSFGGSLRQSLLSLEVFGPQVGGARVGADIQFDFAGGFPDTLGGVTLGLPRLRTGVVSMTWPNTTIVAGQDTLFFSPLSPSSIATLAVPAFAYTGNLWTWIPQVRLEHRLELTNKSSFLFQGGILDSVSGEPPSSQPLRKPQAGEASRQPAYASRMAWGRRAAGREVTIGIGGYYGRQDWGFHRIVNAWAGTSDWTIPLSNRWELTGEFYRGRAVGGLGGGMGRSTVFSGPVANPNTRVIGLNSTGGWAQLKFRESEKLEWNGGFGQDNPLASDLRMFPLSQQTYFDPSLARNRSSLLNFIYRPRSDLLFSVEYRHLRTFTLSGDSEKADHINVSMGVLF
jgi:hypothetical protein